MFAKEREKNKKENEKVANRKLVNLRNLGKVIPSFLISEFSILLYSQNRKHGPEKNSRDFQDFRVFDLTNISELIY